MIVIIIDFNQDCNNTPNRKWGFSPAQNPKHIASEAKASLPKKSMASVKKDTQLLR